MTDDTQFIDSITIILAFISFLACIYVCLCIIDTGFNPFHSKSDIFIPNNYNKQKWIDIIFWMCVTDGLHTIPIIINWFPQAIGIDWPYTSFECVLIGIFAQYFAIQSPLWHILLAYNLGYLLYGKSLNELDKQKSKLYTLMIIIPLICTIIPLIWNDYGRSTSILKKYHDNDCWLKSLGFQMIFVVIGILSVVIHLFVLLYACTKLHNSASKVVFRPHYISIIKKMSGYIIIYFILRFFPLIERMVQFYTNPPPFWLLAAQHIGITLIGIGNAIVWKINQYFYTTPAAITIHKTSDSTFPTFTDNNNNDNNTLTNYTVSTKKNNFKLNNNIINERSQTLSQSTS